MHGAGIKPRGSKLAVNEVCTVYEVRPRKDKRGVDLISDALPFARLWYSKASDAVEYAKFFSRSHNALIRVYHLGGLGARPQTKVIALHSIGGRL